MVGSVMDKLSIGRREAAGKNQRLGAEIFRSVFNNGAAAHVRLRPVCWRTGFLYLILIHTSSLRGVFSMSRLERFFCTTKHSVLAVFGRKTNLRLLARPAN
jgi:hypothetical protein